jgi:sentrin-specific protease 7
MSSGAKVILLFGNLNLLYLFFPVICFHWFSTEDFEDVIYPQGDPDAVSISKRDVELLLPETFVNDTIIDFYIK